MSKHQHGFVPNKSCTTNLLETFDIITRHMADKNPVDFILLDFAKALDKVFHDRLVAKIRSFRSVWEDSIMDKELLIIP